LQMFRFYLLVSSTVGPLNVTVPYGAAPKSRSSNNLVFIICHREIQFEYPRCRLQMFRFSLLVSSIVAPLNVTVPYGTAPKSLSSNNLVFIICNRVFQFECPRCRLQVVRFSLLVPSIVAPYERHCPLWRCSKKSLEQQPCLYQLPSRAPV
jgi:hypothetical protein